jgi:hypothetical protein
MVKEERKGIQCEERKAESNHSALHTPKKCNGSSANLAVPLDRDQGDGVADQ